MKKLNNIITLVAKLLALRRVEVRLSIQLLFTVTVIMLCFNACRKKVEYRDNYITNTVVESHSWQQDNRFPEEQNYTGAYQYNGTTLFTGETYGDYVYDSIPAAWGVFVKDNLIPANTKRFAVNKTFYCYTSPSNPAFNGLYLRCYGYIYNSFAVSQNYAMSYSFGTSITSTPFISDYYGSPFQTAIDVSDSNRVIMPVVSTNTNIGYIAVDFKIPSSTIPTLTVTYTLNVHPRYATIPSSPIPFRSILHIGNRFFISSYDTTYLVRENLSIAKVHTNSQFIYFFKANNIQYALSQETFNGAIYKTLDNGETWNLEFTLNNNLWAILNFDNKLIAVYWDQIFELTITGTQINFKELDNDGLKNKVITGLVKINSDVYISTNGGLFKRPYANFYTAK